jgi:hypothetical protein
VQIPRRVIRLVVQQGDLPIVMPHRRIRVLVAALAAVLAGIATAVALAAVHLLLAANPGAPAAALLHCLHYSPPSARVFAANVQLTAIKVGALTAQ